MKKGYLLNTVVVEPLIWRWHAWTHLIPPHSAACHIVGRHLRIMESYLASPHLHEVANTNPELAGGPFVNLHERKLEEFQRLVNQTYEQCSIYIEIDRQYREFSRILQKEAKGYSLEELYKKLPDLLKGMVELFYDINHSPNIRFFENLIYNKYYDTSHQEIYISNPKNERRPFLLSTPRSSEEGL